jgi:hypothetical protein
MDPLVTDLNEHMGKTINHVCNLLRHPIQSNSNEIMLIGTTGWVIFHMHIFRSWRNKAKYPSIFNPVPRLIVQLVSLQSKQMEMASKIIKTVILTVLGLLPLISLVVLPSQIKWSVQLLV